MCLVRSENEGRKWWGLTIFSPGPPKLFLPKSGRKLKWKLIAIFWMKLFQSNIHIIWTLCHFLLCYFFFFLVLLFYLFFLVCIFSSKKFSLSCISFYSFFIILFFCAHPFFSQPFWIFFFFFLKRKILGCWTLKKKWSNHSYIIF